MAGHPRRRGHPRHGRGAGVPGRRAAGRGRGGRPYGRRQAGGTGRGRVRPPPAGGPPCGGPIDRRGAGRRPPAGPEPNNRKEVAMPTDTSGRDDDAGKPVPVTARCRAGGAGGREAAGPAAAAPAAGGAGARPGRVRAGGVVPRPPDAAGGRRKAQGRPPAPADRSTPWSSSAACASGPTRASKAPVTSNRAQVTPEPVPPAMALPSPAVAPAGRPLSRALTRRRLISFFSPGRGTAPPLVPPSQRRSPRPATAGPGATPAAASPRSGASAASCGTPAPWPGRRPGRVGQPGDAEVDEPGPDPPAAARPGLPARPGHCPA